jgi:hypothetical protein
VEQVRVQAPALALALEATAGPLSQSRRPRRTPRATTKAKSETSAEAKRQQAAAPAQQTTLAAAFCVMSQSPTNN